jgi:ubiquinone/menaquinone biosynthesis C-methylase UbiE
MNRDQLTALYDKQADQYEKLRKKRRTFDHKWRKELLSAVEGKILEVSVGAGANFKFYPKDVMVTAVDISAAMLVKAKEAAADTGITASFIHSSIDDLHFEPGSFDCIVSTLSLCAYDDPVAVLKHFNKWCKKDGSILLLEHGASKYRIVHWIQDKIDGFQYRKIGCHANRNMLKIVKDSGLLVKKCDRKLFGVMYLVWASPSS